MAPVDPGAALFIPEKTPLTELETPPALGGRASLAYIIPAWLNWVREVARLLRRINATGIQHGIVTTDDTGTAEVIAGRLENVAFVATDYTADSGAWDVEDTDVTTWHRLLLGRQLFMAWDFRTTTVTGTPTELRVALPGGNVGFLNVTALCVIDDNGTPRVGIAAVTPGGTDLVFTRLDGGTFATSVDGTGVRGSMFAEVE